MRGYFGIGIENVKTAINIGTLWRSAHAFGAQFIFTVGKRYSNQASDTTKAARHIPLYHHETFEEFYEQMPYNCQLVGIEIEQGARVLRNFIHPERAIYLLGAEDSGLSKAVLEKCNYLVSIPSIYCLNVAVAGSIVMYDRLAKGETE